MKTSANEETKCTNRLFSPAKLAGLLVVILTAFFTTSCGGDDKDDEPDNPNPGTELGSIIGTWVYEESSYDPEDKETASMVMTLKFNSDYTGSVVEDWTYSRASSHYSYSMNFSWSTTSDSNGNDILRVSYVSGDQGMMDLFPGSDNTVLWTRQYVLTGNILNIYGGNGVWVFNRR